MSNVETAAPSQPAHVQLIQMSAGAPGPERTLDGLIDLRRAAARWREGDAIL